MAAAGAGGGGGGGGFATWSHTQSEKEFIASQFKSAEFNLISTHGKYNLNREVISFKVPPNTYVCETQLAGILCLTTIDAPLMSLLMCENREMFMCYFFNDGVGCPGPVVLPAVPGGGMYAAKPAGEIHSAEVYKDVLKQMTFYCPGDDIPIRELSIGRVGHASRIIYKDMNFFRSDCTRGESMKPILQRLHGGMIADGEKIVTNEELIKGVNSEDPTRVRVFFFSSCAAITPLGSNTDTPIRSKRLQQIWELQHSAGLKAHTRGITSVKGPIIESRNIYDFPHTPGTLTSFRNVKQEPAQFAPLVSGAGNQAMSTPDTPLAAAMKYTMGTPRDTHTCTGYALYRIDGSRWIPQTIDGRACLTEEDVNACMLRGEKGTYIVDTYVTGVIDPTKRQTLQYGGRSLWVRRSRRLRVRRRATGRSLAGFRRRKTAKR